MCQGLGRKPQLIMHTRSTALPCFFIFCDMLELRSKPCFKGLLKKSLENLQNFRTEYTTLFWQKLLSFQRTFHEKSFGLGLGQMPQLIIHAKSTALPCFFIYVSFAFKYRLYLPFLVSRFHRIFQFAEIANKRVRLFFGIVLIERYKIYILF